MSTASLINRPEFTTQPSVRAAMLRVCAAAAAGQSTTAALTALGEAFYAFREVSETALPDDKPVNAAAVVTAIAGMHGSL